MTDRVAVRTMDGTRGDLVVYFAGSRWEGPPGHDRHMAEALSHYRPVLFAEPTVSMLTRLKRPELSGVLEKPALQVLNPRLAHLTTAVVPGHTRPGLHYLVPPMVRRAARRAVDRLYGPDDRHPVAAVVYSRAEDLGEAIPARRTLFYATDDGVAGAEMLGLPRERLLRIEARTLNSVDAVAVVSPALRDRYAHAGITVELIPNGCKPQAYADVDRAPRPEGVHLTGPVAGFLGHINDRIDVSLLEAVAGSACSLLIVGPLVRGYQSERFEALADRPNVCWVGPRPYAEMPSFLRLIDVGLTPYADNEFNRGSFPLKTLEYLAAGRGVVATPLPATTWLDTDLITTADNPAEFAAQVRAALAVPRTDALAAQRRAFARRHSWDERAARLARLLGIDTLTTSEPGSSR
jgi:teichuronic acid biosynthesis glycosyltransferase TuaH